MMLEIVMSNKEEVDPLMKTAIDDFRTLSP